LDDPVHEITAGNFSAARKLLERIVKRTPTDTDRLAQLGHVQERLGLVDESYQTFRRAYRLDEGNFLAAKNMLSAELNAGRAEAALTIADKIVDRAGDDHEFYSMWLLAATSSPDVTAQDLRARHERYASKFDLTGPESSWTAPAIDKQRVVHIGYFSHHFYAFPLAAFLPNILRLHDRKNFKVFAFAAAGKIDDITREYVAAADEYYDLASMSDDEAAACIRNCQIDVLIDVSGLVHGNRFSILRKRVARLQMSWLGYLGSYGSNAIDYQITDQYATPPETADAIVREKCIWLSGSQFPYAPRSVASTKNVLVLPPASTTFGVFCASTKLNRVFLDAIAQILDEVEGSRLCVVAQSRVLRETILNALSQRRVKASRVTFLPHLPLEEYFSALAHVDIVLDSFPHTGGTTVCDALWMGTPVIAHFSARVFGGGAASVLSVVGLDKLVARAAQEYVAIAVAFAQDAERRQYLRSELAARFRSSAICDHERTRLLLEQGVVTAFRKSLAGEPPEHIHT
jgi:protein O-GlcNAc transferase